MRLLLFSNAPHCGTGYGTQTALLATRLRDAGHDVAILAYFGLEGARLEWEGIPVFPRSRHPASQDWMVPLARQLNAEAVVAITDAWIVETHRFKGSDLAYVPWFPVDGEPMDQENRRGIIGPGPVVRVPVATSAHAARMAADQGVTGVRTARYMVDCDVYRPGDRDAARLDWGIPVDAFVVGLVAMNKHAGGVDRKRFFEQIGAFARLRERHSDALLYLHTHTVAADGVPIQEMLAHWGVPSDAVMFTSGAVMTVGAPPPLMAQLYQSFDVLLGCTGGEGAGVPLLEASACGVPQVWGDWTAMPEYAKAGWVVERDEAQPAMNNGRVIWMTPRIDAVADRLEQAYDASSGVRARLAEQARAGALEHNADDAVPRDWAPILTHAAEKLEERGQVKAIEIPDLIRPEGVPVAAP